MTDLETEPLTSSIDDKSVNTITIPLYGLIFMIGMIIVLVCALISVLLLYNTPYPKQPELDYETYHEQFNKGVQAEMIREEIQLFSSDPHVAGSFKDFELAEKTFANWKSYGLDVRVETVPVLLTYPGQGSFVKMVYPTTYNCSLWETVVNDSTSGNPNAPPIWNGWSANGTVEERELVYVNYGTKEDFDAISHINLTGKVVIVRYGKIYRGDKVKFAEERGAAAVLIYSDPQDTQQGPAYPVGPWGTNSSAQRGTVWKGNGDPLTPGWPSSSWGPTIPLTEAQHGSDLTLLGKLPGIPVQPLSSGNARPLLESLRNYSIPNSSWSGGFNLSHIGPGPTKVSVCVNASFTVMNIWNVIGIVKGSVEPDRMVIIGSHRDAWSFGAVDSIGGHACLSEIARGVGLLLDQGWKPRRTIVFCSWDAEEYGLIGSFEFTEKWHKQLISSAVAYLNIDGFVTGPDLLSVSGTPALIPLLFELTKSIDVGSTPMYDLWPSKRVNLLGDGSDFSSFIQRLGVPSLFANLASNPDSYEAVYHSNYDSYYWISHFGDPFFEYHASMTRLYGLLLLSLSDSTVVPFHYIYYSDLIDELISQLNSTSLNLTNLYASAKAFKDAAEYTENTFYQQVEEKTELQIRTINDALIWTERAFLTEDPLLSGNPYYRHVISTPSQDDSYVGKAFPAIYAAFNNNDLQKAQFIADRIALVIDAAGGVLRNSIMEN